MSPVLRENDVHRLGGLTAANQRSEIKTPVPLEGRDDVGLELVREAPNPLKVLRQVMSDGVGVTPIVAASVSSGAHFNVWDQNELSEE